MKKKVIAVLLSAIMTVSMIGCGSSSEAPAAPADSSTEQAPAAEEPGGGRKKMRRRLKASEGAWKAS